MELTIDTASPVASIALSDAGVLVAEITWFAGRGHAAELTPAIDRLLAGAGAARSDLRAVFVNRGPGGYAGLRVGVSTALAIASALDIDLLGFGRLTADALPFLGFGRSVCAVHDAGRGDVAWAFYDAGAALPPVEDALPSFGDRPALIAALPSEAIVVGDGAHVVAGTEAVQQRVFVHDAGARRAATGAALAWRRYESGARDDRFALTPIYLRAPNITAARVRPTGAGPRGQR